MAGKVLSFCALESALIQSAQERIVSAVSLQLCRNSTPIRNADCTGQEALHKTVGDNQARDDPHEKLPTDSSPLPVRHATCLYLWFNLVLSTRASFPAHLRPVAAHHFQWVPLEEPSHISPPIFSNCPPVMLGVPRQLLLGLPHKSVAWIISSIQRLAIACKVFPWMLRTQTVFPREVFSDVSGRLASALRVAPPVELGVAFALSHSDCFPALRGFKRRDMRSIQQTSSVRLNWTPLLVSFPTVQIGFYTLPTLGVACTQMNVEFQIRAPYFMVHHQQASLGAIQHWALLM